MKVAILGSNGFIGQAIAADLFVLGYDVICVTRADLNLSNFEAVKEFLYREKPFAIVNCTIPAGRSKIDNLSQSDFNEHLKIFLNFFNLSHLFEKFINIGSGAEFDRRTSISYAHETDILTCTPVDLYGLLKNTTSRIAMANPKFYTLRIFGCFDKSEATERFFGKLSYDDAVVIEDRYMDFISLKDFSKVLQFYLNNDVIYKDVNCVYPDKIKLSDLASFFVNFHNLKVAIAVTKSTNIDYTGNSGRLDILNLPLDGLRESLRNYFY